MLVFGSDLMGCQKEIFFYLIYLLLKSKVEVKV